MTTSPGYRVADGADVSESAQIGEGSAVWHLAQIREGARLGRDCVIGRGAYIDAGVHLGDGCKVQNHALVYEPAQLADGVFVGPAAVFTNDHFPRAVNPDLTPKSADDWDPVGVTCEQGSSIGARAVCVAPVRIGAWSMVAAGATVIHDVPPHALVAGVPARRIAWVGRAGVKLEPASDGTDAWVCPATGEWYVADETSGGLTLASETTIQRQGTAADADIEPEQDGAQA
jgi:UDP-2-acetamido-3-amino-2,3-dideoxy-glucuronate N-acetyltransferase